MGGFAASPDLRLKGHPTKINSGVHCCAINNTDSFTGSTYPENGILQVQTNLRATKKASGSEFKNHCWQQRVLLPIFLNIAKGTTDPRVEFISQDHSSQILNICITISESQISVNFKISTKHQHLD